MDAIHPDASEPLPAADDARVTPLMEQYVEIKGAHPDHLLFYRMGDFYELFFEDAEAASRALGIVLTKRGKHRGRDIPMCGVPIHRSDEYLHRLIAQGFRVAVCEQTEDPAEAKKRGPKSVVARDVIRLVTAGTLTEETLLDPKRNNYLLAVARAKTRHRRRRRRRATAGSGWPISTFPPANSASPSVTAPLAGRDRAARTGRDHRFRRALRRPRADAAVALAAGGHAARARRVRRRHRAAPARHVFRGSDGRCVRGAVAARTHRGGRLHHLCGAHPARQTSAAVAARARNRRGDARNRCRHARQPRTDAHAKRRAQWCADHGHRPHRDGRGRKALGAAPRRAAHRPAGDRPPARRGRNVRGGGRPAHGCARQNCGGARSRPRAGAARGRPRRPARPRRHPRRVARCGGAGRTAGCEPSGSGRVDEQTIRVGACREPALPARATRRAPPLPEAGEGLPCDFADGRSGRSSG